jgi:hypothetical protein
VPSLSDKLKALGVRLGPAELAPPRPPSQFYNIQEVLKARHYSTLVGDTYIVEQSYPPGYLHGQSPLNLTAAMRGMAAWAGEARLLDLPPQAYVFLDTETTGLQGGTGTYAFLIGVGRFEGESFHLAQFFMQDPAAEPAQLAALDEFLAPCQVLVTYNGKAFDIPLLNARYLTHGLSIPYNGYAHIDLLHLSRRLWRDRLASRTLANIEAHILGSTRTSDDVPGWMIPQLYFDYLRSGDPAPLVNVFYHNAMDVVSLAALLNRTAAMLDDPFSPEIRHAVDMVSLAKLFEDLGDLDTATQLYIHGLHHLTPQEGEFPRQVYLSALLRLASIHKHTGDYPAAADLWREAAGQGDINAHVELAKYYEHHRKDYPEAIVWTRAALASLGMLSLPHPVQQIWLSELERRLERVTRKLSARTNG